jgi:hypothetical protein
VEGGQPDRRNNVESIFIEPSALPEGFEGNFTITVRAANVAGDGVPGNGVDLDQDFALLVYNIAAPIDPPVVPAIAEATYQQKTLTIRGQNFSANAQVEINGRAIQRPFVFDQVARTLTTSAKRRKLNLNRGVDNQIVIIEAGKRSEAFLLRI